MAGNRRALALIKAIHTLVWALVEAAMVYLLVTGVAGRTDRRTAVAGAIVGGESLVFLANGARCPLTDVAEALGADKGSVTDIYLPGWLARSLPMIHVPLVLTAVWLHVRNVKRTRSDREISGA